MLVTSEKRSPAIVYARRELVAVDDEKFTCPFAVEVAQQFVLDNANVNIVPVVSKHKVILLGGTSLVTIFF